MRKHGVPIRVTTEVGTFWEVELTPIPIEIARGRLVGIVNNNTKTVDASMLTGGCNPSNDAINAINRNPVAKCKRRMLNYV
ncbi:MAG TPA: hypothetical protein DDZ88_08575 [Verrucomicrobiales bacterium]|nr:hypothetical protein [Verrucomicrobiales bacterium]